MLNFFKVFKIMNLFKRNTSQESLGKYILLFLTFLFMNNLMATTRGENFYLDKVKT